MSGVNFKRHKDTIIYDWMCEIDPLIPIVTR